MRLWHKDLIDVLPRQQVLGQWRECCLIAKNISETGTPNHLLVNKIMDYPIEHFVSYSLKVYDEMLKRGYNPEWENFIKWASKYPDGIKIKYYDNLFGNWHNDRYLIQCCYNLQEKYDCGGISIDEWLPIRSKYLKLLLAI